MGMHPWHDVPLGDDIEDGFLAVIEIPMRSKVKYELDAPANKDFRYLTKTYLPRKLKEEEWLD